MGNLALFVPNCRVNPHPNILIAAIGVHLDPNSIIQYVINRYCHGIALWIRRQITFGSAWTPKQNCLYIPHALQDFYFCHTNNGIEDGDIYTKSRWNIIINYKILHKTYTWVWMDLNCREEG